MSRMEKCDYFKITNNHLQIYIKMPFLAGFGNFAKRYNSKYANGYENYLGESIDVTGKYLILTFVLRNKEDILPYLNISEEENK